MKAKFLAACAAALMLLPLMLQAASPDASASALAKAGKAATMAKAGNDVTTSSTHRSTTSTSTSCISQRYCTKAPSRA